jgi:hypothetical protein
MDGLEIAYRRLHNQHLSGPSAADPAAVVAHLGAVQAQEYAVAKWSVAQRTTGVDDAAMQRAVDDGLILRTHALRPTWHFVAARDIRWVQAVTGPRVHQFNGYQYRLQGVDDELAAKACKIFARVLRGGNHLTRKELAEALATEGIEASGVRLGCLVLYAELEALICNGTMRGKQHTYALVEERAPDAVELDADTALAELTRRYFTSHGPATIKDFGWWSSLTVAKIKRGIAMLGDELALEDGFYLAPTAKPRVEDATHVLQGYDEFVVSYSESKWVFNVARNKLGTFSENALMHPLVLDGQVIGFWKRIVGRNQLMAHLFPAIPVEKGAFQAQFDRYAAFAGVPVEVVET